MHEESRRLQVDVAAIRATVDRLAVEQEHFRAELRELREDLRADLRELREDLRVDMGAFAVELRRLDNKLFHTLLGVLATLATAVGALVAALVA